MIDVFGFKPCIKCGERKNALEAFNAHKSASDGRHPWCKDCMRVYKRADAEKQRHVEKESGLRAFPRRVRLRLPFGYIEEATGRTRSWNAGELITDLHEIAILVRRGAPLEVLPPLGSAT